MSYAVRPERRRAQLRSTIALTVARQTGLLAARRMLDELGGRGNELLQIHAEIDAVAAELLQMQVALAECAAEGS